ncbi:MAG TPA: hotdog fold thioesterase [Spongiibacteraceae bacterium]|nr:hotdog fold thioesterase [Spongiibacteraceae bacterium]
MSIWKAIIPTLPLADSPQYSLNQHLDIKIVEIGADYVKASMPVDERTRRSRGILHGGASVALAETVGGYAAQLCLDADEYCVGLQINANHIRRVEGGLVYAVTTPVHIGRSTQVWDIRIADPQDRIVCMSRLTLTVMKR